MCSRHSPEPLHAPSIPQQSGPACRRHGAGTATAIPRRLPPTSPWAHNRGSVHGGKVGTGGPRDSQPAHGIAPGSPGACGAGGTTGRAREAGEPGLPLGGARGASRVRRGGLGGAGGKRRSRTTCPPSPRQPQSGASGKAVVVLALAQEQKGPSAGSGTNQPYGTRETKGGLQAARSGAQRGTSAAWGSRPRRGAGTSRCLNAA